MRQRARFMLMASLLAVASSALASTTWYVNGVSGSDSNNCMSAQTACKTIGHAISLASSGDSIGVAAATYNENLTIGINLKVIGVGASTTIIDGGGHGTVVTVSSSIADVSLSKVTVQNGFARPAGGGIYNVGTLTINKITLSGNGASFLGGGAGFGGGIANYGSVTVNNSTFTGNWASGEFGYGLGGGMGNAGTATINNSTLSGNSSADGGGIENDGNLKINNSTISGNKASSHGGGIYNHSGVTTLQNTIVANSTWGGNCSGTISSNGYNLSSDGTCNFNNAGDLNNTDPQLGPLQNNGGPTQTMALPSGSPAIDAGNPSGCTDNRGHLLTTDQRGMPRPDKEDTGGCDMGAYERQSD